MLSEAFMKMCLSESSIAGRVTVPAAVLWNPPPHSHWGHISLGCCWPVTEHSEDAKAVPFWETCTSLNSEFTLRTLRLLFKTLLGHYSRSISYLIFFLLLPPSSRLDLHLGLSQPSLTSIPFSLWIVLAPFVSLYFSYSFVILSLWSISCHTHVALFWGYSIGLFH